VGTQTAANSNAACAPFIPTGTNTYPAVGASGNPIEAAPAFGSGAGAQSAAAATTIAGVLGLYPVPNAGATDLGGFANYTDAGSLAESEDYVLGRVDYNLSSKDEIFGRYVSDRARRANPFAGSLALPDWPEVDHTANQYFTLQERRIVSANVVNQVRFNFTRTFEDANTTTAPNPLLEWVAGFPDGTISAGCPGCAPLGANTALPYDLAQNKIGGGDDIVWIQISTHRSSSGEATRSAAKRHFWKEPPADSWAPIRASRIPTAIFARPITRPISRMTGKCRPS
jgi:hypothetical protein